MATVNRLALHINQQNSGASTIRVMARGGIAATLIKA